MFWFYVVLMGFILGYLVGGGIGLEIDLSYLFVRCFRGEGWKEFSWDWDLSIFTWFF